MKLRLIIFSFVTLSLLNYVHAQWSNLQGGANDPVRAFYSDSTDSLYVVGRFTQIGGSNINQVALWDGINWTPFGTNERFGSPHDVECIAKFNNQIIVGGLFDSIGNLPVNNIAKWNGNAWEEMGMGLNNIVAALYVYNGELYAGGSFSNSGMDTVRSLAKWNGINWESVLNMSGSVLAFTEIDNKLIIAGNFELIGITAPNIIGFDGVNLDTSISKLNDMVVNVRNIRDTLYACGSFTAGPVNTSNYISAYYNNTWHPLPYPTGGQNTITDYIEYNNKKYVCGYFTDPPDIGVYNGLEYDSLFNANGFFTRMHVFNGKLFIAGQFFQIIAGQNYYCVMSFDDFSNNINDDIKQYPERVYIWPNPSFGGEINIRISEAESSQFDIFSMDGRLINQYTIYEYLKINLQQGTYYLRFIDKDNRKQTKLIIVK